MAKRKPSKWKDSNYVTAYCLAKDGASDGAIAKALGVTTVTFNKWLSENEALAKAVCEGRSASETKQGIYDYIYDRLPRRVQDLWDRIEGVDKMSTSDPVEKLDKRRRRRALDREVELVQTTDKQRLFVYAYVACNFNKSEACRKTGIALPTVLKWSTDPQFKQFLDQVKEAKKDFFEDALVSLVKSGDSAATIFVNKTINRDRGYNDRVAIDVNHKVEYSIEELGLSVEQKRALLEKMREAEVKRLEDNSNTIDAEFEVKETTHG